MFGEVRRVFLDSRAPFVPAAAAWIARLHAPVLAAVSSERIGRALAGHLPPSGPDRSPRIVARRSLADALIRDARPPASPLVRRLAWVLAVRSLPAAERERLFGDPPSPSDETGWTRIARTLDLVHAEVADGAHTFADVASRVGADGQDATRWRILARVQEAYLASLRGRGLGDPAYERIAAIAEGRIETDREVVLVALTDLSAVDRRILARLGDGVSVLIHDHEENARAFDPFGIPVSSPWVGAHFEVPEASIVVCETPIEVARQVATVFGEEGGKGTVFVAPDRDVRSAIRAELALTDLSSSEGRSLNLASPMRLASAIADVLTEPTFEAVAALARHPDAFDPVVQSDLLAALDRFAADRIPYAVDEAPIDALESAERAVRAVFSLLAPLRGEARPLCAWAAPIRAVFGSVYDGKTLPPHDAYALGFFYDALAEAAESPAEIAPSVDASRALRSLVEVASEARTPSDAEAHGPTRVAFHEAPFEDARRVVIAGFEDGSVPGRLPSVPFLTDALRRRLGLMCDRDLHARDAYVFSLLLRKHPDLRIFVAKTGMNGTALTPSRFLFSCDDAELPARALRLYGPTRAASDGPTPVLRPGRARTAFVVPQPLPLQAPFDALSVTAFRDYLACPYRFYLRHALALRAIDDRQEELDGRAFGSLAHDILCDFGRGDVAGSTSEAQIRDDVLARLDDRFRRKFGARSRPAVRVQIEQLRARLIAFASWQARWAGGGWKIAHTELDIPRGRASMNVDGIPFGLHGRIDRVDVNEITGEHVVFDYKTADAPKDPDATHRRAGRWIDLQLPLYRHLVRARGIAGEVRLGYVTLPREVDRTTHTLATWTSAELADADGAAAAVIRGVRDQVFWPPADPAPPFAEIYAAICQDDAFLEDEGELAGDGAGVAVGGA